MNIEQPFGREHIRQTSSISFCGNGGECFGCVCTLPPYLTVAQAHSTICARRYTVVLYSVHGRSPSVTSAAVVAVPPRRKNQIVPRRGGVQLADDVSPTSGKFADGLSAHDFDPHLLPRHPHQRHYWRTKTRPFRRRPPVTSAGNWTRRFHLHCEKC